MILYAPARNPQEFDYDEGLNMMKALLVERGYTLYTEIWSDQPPLMTVALARWMQLWGTTITAARWLVILLSAALLWALYRTMQLTCSRIAAWIAILLLVISEEYIRLSSSVMVGVPALSLTVLALYWLLASSHRRVLWLLSALVMAAALQTKLMVAIVLPAAALHMVWGEPEQGSTSLWQRMGRAVAWWLGVSALFLSMSLAMDAWRPDMLLVPHLGSETRTAFASSENVAYLLHAAQMHAPYLLLAFFGVISAWRRHRLRQVIVPGAWLLTAVAALLYHKPLWHHHITLLTIPLAWLCAFGVDGLCSVWRAVSTRTSRGTRATLYGMSAVAGIVLVAIFSLYPKPLPERINEYTYRNRPPFVAEIVNQLRLDGGAQLRWIFTDRPYYALQAGAVVPPPIAVLSRKRLESGQITEEMLRQVIESYRPEYIVLERFLPEYSPQFLQELEQEYQLTINDNGVRYYATW